LRAEIVRLARREFRDETRALKKTLAACRSEIAALKRRTRELEKRLRREGMPPGPAAASPDHEESRPAGLRFSAKGLAAQRKRLGLSVNDIGLLVGASGQSVYNWIGGQVRPRAVQMERIAMLRTIGKREAAARLEALRAGT
jgi:hypothetical protein